jgi:hypothetical protein
VPDDESRAEAARLVGLTRLALRDAAVCLNADGLDGLCTVRSPRQPRTQLGERVWLGLRQRFLWRHVLDDREMVTVCREAWNRSCLKAAIFAQPDGKEGRFISSAVFVCCPCERSDAEGWDCPIAACYS